MNLKGMIIALLVFITLMYGHWAYAQTTYLVVPAHYWGGGYTPTRVFKFYDWRDWPGEHQCGIAARSLHKDDKGPMYSFCSMQLPNNLKQAH